MKRTIVTYASSLRLGIVMLGVMPTAALAASVTDMLHRVDQSRGHTEQGLTYDIDVTCDVPGSPAVKRIYNVRSKGENAVATITAPAERGGEQVVFNGQRVWQLQKTSRRPVAVTIADRMAGGMATVGDIVATGFAAIYAGEIVGKSMLDGEAVQELALKSVKDISTFEQARLFVSDKTGLGLRVELAGASGKALRSVSFTYGNSLELGGKKIPFVSKAEVKSLDQQSDSGSCTITYGAPQKIEATAEEFELKRVTSAKAP